MACYKVSLALILVLAYFASPSFAEDLRRQFLDAQNKARAEVNADPLTWDDEVAAYAQKYANQRICDCSLVHSNSDKYGENIAWGSDDLSIKEAVKMWIDEKTDYDYNSNTCASGKVCGHYTQVVWLNSVRIGCAKVRCNSGGTFITCNYYPPRNYVGELPY